MSSFADRKRSIDLIDLDDSQAFPYPKIAKKKTTKPAFDLNLEIPSAPEKTIAPYSINLGRGVTIEVKEFRRNFFIGFTKTDDNGDVKNRFNLPVDMAPLLLKASEAIVNHVTP